MYNWTVQPLAQVSEIKFGMTRKAVRKVIGSEVKEFKKSKFSKTTTDDFGFCHVFYNMNDECEAVEVFDDVTIIVNGSVVFPASLETAKNIFSDLEEESGSYISKFNSVGIGVSNGKIESILFGAKGYYR